jgi:cytochrome c oxidase subunit 2
VRGTDADGVIGPDLTHVGGRSSLAAGLLANETADFVGWVARTHELKPGATMPAFGMLAKDDLHALGVYLDGLR